MNGISVLLAQTGTSEDLSCLIMIALILAAIYFAKIHPQQKRKKEEAEKLASVEQATIDAFPAGDKQMKDEAERLHAVLGGKYPEKMLVEVLAVIKPHFFLPVMNPTHESITGFLKVLFRMPNDDASLVFDFLTRVSTETYSQEEAEMPKLVKTIFDDGPDLVNFFVSLSRAARATDDGCIALLAKVTPDRWMYSIKLPDGRHSTTMLKPFKPSKENFRVFEEGCREHARRFAIYLRTGDERQVPTSPPTFGRLTYASEGSFDPDEAGFVDLEPDKGPPEFAIPYPDGRELIGGSGRTLPQRQITCPECMHAHTIDAHIRNFECENCGEYVIPSITIF